MTIDYEAWRFWVSIAQTLVTMAIAIYVWMVTKDRVTNKRITDLDTKMSVSLDLFKERQGAKCAAHQVKCAAHHQRTASLEVSVKNVPTHDDIGAVHDRITAVKGGVDELAGLIKGMRDNVNLLVDHHLRGDKG